MKCLVDYCDKPERGHQKYCMNHLARRQRGEVDWNKRSRKEMSYVERFWSRVEKTATCWNWMGANVRGYGHIGIEQKNYKVHRLSYEWAFGPFDQELTIDHLCCNPSCVNPGHLEVVTQGENNRRRGARMTECKRGHAYVDGSYYQTVFGSRACKECNLMYGRKGYVKGGA